LMSVCRVMSKYKLVITIFRSLNII
jgi:hypothetical protein